MKLDQCFSCFAWWDYCLPYHVRPHLICETWCPKNRGILAEFGWSTYTLNALYFVLYISNISKWNTTRPKKPMIEKRMTYLYLFVLVPNYHEIIWERNCEKKRCTPLVFIQVKENLETTFFLLFFHFFYTAINVIKTVLNCVVSFKVHEKSRTLIF